MHTTVREADTVHRRACPSTRPRCALHRAAMAPTCPLSTRPVAAMRHASEWKAQCGGPPLTQCCETRTPLGAVSAHTPRTGGPLRPTLRRRFHGLRYAVPSMARGRIIRRTSVSACLRLLILSLVGRRDAGWLALRSLAPRRWRGSPPEDGRPKGSPILCVLPQERCYSPFLAHLTAGGRVGGLVECAFGGGAFFKVNGAVGILRHARVGVARHHIGAVAGDTMLLAADGPDNRISRVIGTGHPLVDAGVERAAVACRRGG